MGMIDRLMGMGSTVAAVGSAATGMAQILTPNATRRMELDEEAYARAIAEQQAEFSAVSVHWFDAAVNGLNRLPRPLLTLGTIGLFVYAMVEPAGFSTRMEGLALVPEPLWLTDEEALSFCANSVVVGTTVVMPVTPVRVGRQLEAWGFDVVTCDVSEFLKAGGGCRCLTLALDTPLGPGPVAAP